MKGILICFLVIVTVTAVRSQGPPTKTKKGVRLARQNDNPDIGLPSGADVPDGRRFPVGRRAAGPAARPAARPAVRPAVRAAARPAARPATRPAARPAPMAARRPAARPAGRPMATMTKSGPPPARRNDNPDFGLPSGRDYPDAGFRRAPAPAAAPAPFMPFAPAVPAAPAPAVPAVPAPAAPTFDCDYFCNFEGYKPVCTIYGNEYDNDCYRQCRNEPRDCENACPCNNNPAPPTPDPIFGNPWAVNSCSHCAAEGNDPVCVDDETNYQNECYALCEGKTITCSSSCPC